MTEIALCRAYDEAGLASAQGARVLVDRVWPRGVTKAALALDLWAKDAAPSTALRRWFGHDPAKWEEFQRRYTAELDAGTAVAEPVQALARQGAITLIYGAKDEAHNQAVVLRDWLSRKG